MTTWFSRLFNWQTDASNGIGIRADRHDSEDDNFATGINASLNIAGLNSPTANISMGGFKLTNAALGTSAADYARLDQAQTRVIAYAADSVGTDSYAITLSPALAAYAVGQSFYFAAGVANTGAATLNINGLGAKTIKKDKDSDLNDGDIAQNQIIHVTYDGTNFQMQTPAHGQMNQTLSAIYAADGGGSDSYAIALTPALSAYATGLMINFKANTANTGAASLNVNGLGAKTIKKDQIADLSDNDIAANQIVQVIYDGTNFQLLSPIFGCVGQNGQSIYAADVGATDSYAITLVPALPAYKTGMVVRFKANTANTGACSLAVNGLSAITIKKDVSVDLLDNDIKANQLVEAIYDGTNFQMISQRSNSPTITTPTAYTVICAGTSSTNPLQSVSSVGTSGQALVSNGAAALPTFQAVSGAQLVFLAATTASSSASVAFTSVFSSTYDQYLITMTNILPATNSVNLTTVFGENGSYVTSGYSWNQKFTGASIGGGSTDIGVASAASIINTSTTASFQCSNLSANGGVNGWMAVNVTNGTTSPANLTSMLTYGSFTSGAFLCSTFGGGSMVAAPAAAVTDIKFAFSSGNIASGIIRIYGVKTS